MSVLRVAGIVQGQWWPQSRRAVVLWSQNQASAEVGV
ncbi:MAG: hypothetical protein RL215_1364 [Planctomycetota bacterium]